MGGTSIGSNGHPSLGLGTPDSPSKGLNKMTDSVSSDAPSLNPSSSKPGRPSYDAADQVFAYVRSKETESVSLSQACKGQLVVYNAGRKVARKLKGNHLEAVFRRSEHDRIVPWERPTIGYTHAWPTFMGRPLPRPFGAATPPARKAGRKKNIRPS